MLITFVFLDSSNYVVVYYYILSLQNESYFTFAMLIGIFLANQKNIVIKCTTNLERFDNRTPD